MNICMSLKKKGALHSKTKCQTISTFRWCSYFQDVSVFSPTLPLLSTSGRAWRRRFSPIWRKTTGFPSRWLLNLKIQSFIVHLSLTPKDNCYRLDIRMLTLIFEVNQNRSSKTRHRQQVASFCCSFPAELGSLTSHAYIHTALLCTSRAI